MSPKRLINALSLILGSLLLCACPVMDPAGPDGPDGPETPAGDYFKLMINLSTEVPDDYEVVFNTDATGTNFIVETNQSDWSISSDAPWCTVQKTEATQSEKATAVILVSDYDVRDESGLVHNLPARECNVRVTAGTLYDKTIRVVQQGVVFFNVTDSFIWDQSLFSYVLELSAAGEEKDAYILTNCYKWIPSTDASWLTVSRKDQVTLHLVSQPAPSGEGPRSARVTLTDANDEFRSITFTVRDKAGTAPGHGEEHTDWTYPEGVSTELMPGAVIVTPEMTDMIHVISIGSDYMKDVNGEAVRYDDGGVAFRPTLYLLVHDNLGLQEGNWLIFNFGSALVPDGGVFKIESVTPMGGGYSNVFARTEANIAAPFKEMKIGREMFDADDNEIEGAGVDLDVSSYVRQVLDEDGNPVPFDVSPSGELLFSEAATSQLTGIPTKAGTSSKSVTLPEASLSYSGDHMEASLGARMSIDYRTAVGFFNGEAQYVYYTAHPSLKLTASFTAKAEVSADKSKRFFKIEFAPIPAAPGVVLIPSLELWGKIGVNANIKFTTSATFTYDMGTYGVSYNKGDGFTVRHKPADPGRQDEIHPEVNGLSGSLSAFAGLSVRPYLSVYGLFGLGLDLDCLLNFGLSAAEEDLSCKLSLYPSLQITPRVITLGGYYTKAIKKFSGSISLDPLWERYLTPSVAGLNINVPGHLTKTYYKFKMGSSDYNYVTQLYAPDGSLNYNFKVEGQVLTPVKIGLVVLRGSHDDVSFISVNNALSDYPFSDYLAAGIPTYSADYSHVVMNHLWDTVARERLEEIGIYDVDAEEQSFEGNINFTPESAKPYWYGICYIGEDGMILRQKISSSIYSPYIYLWPTDWWGREYVPDN